MTGGQRPFIGDDGHADVVLWTNHRGSKPRAELGQILAGENRVDFHLAEKFQEILPRFALTVDYFDIKVKGEITQLGAAQVLRGCYDAEDFPNNPLCSLFRRGNIGDPENLIDVQDSRVYLQMGGGCQGCAASAATLRQGIERMVREQVPEIQEIIDVTDPATIHHVALYLGAGRIVEADLWERDFLDLVGPAMLTIRADGHGEIAFGAMQAGLDIDYAPSMVFFTWFGFDEMDLLSPFMDDIYRICEVQGLPVDAVMKESGPGQFEINLHHVADPLKACDQAILLERAIKQVARRHGVIALPVRTECLLG